MDDRSAALAPVTTLSGRDSMEGNKLYLRENVQVEPLVDQWYAWSHLLSPATAARNITGRHFKIMDSYIASPEVHAAAVKNPRMLGGPFIDYDGKRVDEIRSLRAQTMQKRSQMLELSKALDDLDACLQMKAKGYSLQPLYADVPPILKGYVELVYDLNNYPSFKLIEPLLYRSPYYDRAAQSLMLSLTKGDDRPFALSTPRLENEDSLHLRIPFDDQRVDQLFRLKSEPKAFDEIAEITGLNGDSRERALLRSLLTETPPPTYVPYEGSGVRWRYFGHACILIEAGGVSMMFDPVLSYTYESDISRYTYLDLPPSIDYVMITHNHQDHILFETLLQIRDKVKTIVVPRNSGGTLQDPSLELVLKNAGFTNVIGLDQLQQISIEKGSITGLPFLGEHADLNIHTKLAYLVKVGPHSLLFAADSCNIEPKLYEHLHRELGDVDAVFLGMECDGAPLSWIYGPLLTRRLDRRMDESRRLAGSNFEQARSIVDEFRCKETYVYAMGQEPWLNYVMSIKYNEQSRPIVESNRLLEYCRGRGITAERLYGEKEILLH
ncbi:MAG TPA: MBL fold metallo-hydrolase [Candidatus Angelobacter sp.]|nr:MBL fold metallo-hydrolase [Candidatus Angelobacter sp.]